MKFNRTNEVSKLIDKNLSLDEIVDKMRELGDIDSPGQPEFTIKRLMKKKGVKDTLYKVNDISISKVKNNKNKEKLQKDMERFASKTAKEKHTITGNNEDALETIQDFSKFAKAI